jgi:hypothetical protein
VTHPHHQALASHIADQRVLLVEATQKVLRHDPPHNSATTTHTPLRLQSESQSRRADDKHGATASFLMARRARGPHQRESAHIAGVVHEPLLEEHVERGLSEGARQVAAAEGVEVLHAQRLGDVPLRHHRRQREAVTDRLSPRQVKAQ